MPNRSAYPTPTQNRTCSRECPGLYIPYYQTCVRETPPPAPWARPAKVEKNRSCIDINLNCGIQ